MMIVQLGKLGDCINVLPFAYMMSKKIGRVNWLVGRPWASLLEGVSYVNPMIWEGTDDDLPRVLRQYRGHQMWITQAWKNPDTKRETNSFTKEQWRYVGALNELGKWPLVFDKRNPEREDELLRKHIQGAPHPVVLVGTTSVSTPYRYAPRLLNELKEGLPQATVIGLDDVKAERIYDLIALYDAADLLVTVDTCHLHLARASQCPVIALINDLPILGAPWWNGGTAPPQTVAAWGYNELGDDLSPVIVAARNQLSRKIDSIAVVCNTYSKGHTDRHKRAMMTHPHGTIYADFEHRPTLKELLGRGLNEHKDAVIYTNDDVTFPDGALDKIRRHLMKFDFGCSRRPRDPVHCGRDIFWFTDDFLRRNWESLPNPYWSVQKPDLILARWMRHLKGIPTTLENLNYDFPPVEVPDVITHENHESNWSNHDIENSKEGLHNEILWEAGV